jgi:HPr kinase/phosphorylase
MKTDKVTVERFFKEHEAELKLKLLAGGGGMDRVISEPSVNRPGLILAGFKNYFAHKRVQALGNADVYYLRSLSEAKRRKAYVAMFEFPIPCIVFSRGLRPDDLLVKMAEQESVPLFQTSLVTMKFINLAARALEVMFAPHGTEMGSMVDILGIGVIIKGESGIGKSESVLALVERGYSLVSDDVTLVTLVDGRKVIGTSNPITRDHMEVRGIGIINVGAMFGIKSIRSVKKVDLVVSLKAWNDLPDVERVGMEQEYHQILGVDIPHIIIPVKPGRDIARLIEVAAFHTKLKIAGYNPAKELNDRLVAQMAAQKSK